MAIVGAGMAGASLAAELAGKAEVLLLEAESRPGFHSTDRSAAFLSETYGGPFIQPLTTASAVGFDEVEKRPVHVDDGAVLVEHILADQAVDGAVGERPEDMDEATQIGDRDPVLTDVHSVGTPVCWHPHVECGGT